jgi:glycosyltransferase involved in cell wall biosynthesis
VLTDPKKGRHASPPSASVGVRHAFAAGTGPLPLVLHLVTDLRLGGTQSILLERVRRPGPFRHAVLCFAARTGGGQAAQARDLTTAFGEAGVPVYRLDLATPAEMAVATLTGRLGARIREVLAATQPSIIHSTLFHVHLLGAWLARRARLPHVASKEGTDDWMGPWQRWLETRALRGATRVTAVSAATARVVRQLGVEESRLEIIPNGIDFARPGGWVVPSRVSPGPHLVGVGRLDPVKGWDDLLDAMALLQGSHPGLVFDLLGSGTEAEAERLRKRAATLGLTDRVRIHPDAPPHSEAHRDEMSSPRPILVVPSREEGFGLVLLEGMARGLPIVATRAGGIPEVARHDIEALLVPPRDPPALAAAIAQAHADPALVARLVCGGRARVAKFPATAMVDAYHRLYAELLDRTGPPRSPAP